MSLEKTPEKEKSKKDLMADAAKERRMFVKRKTCWYMAKKITPDWKDPNTYAWVLNEFGKISPARITGISPKFQRQVNRAIKRARCVGILGYMSNRVTR